MKVDIDEESPCVTTSQQQLAVCCLLTGVSDRTWLAGPGSRAGTQRSDVGRETRHGDGEKGIERERLCALACCLCVFVCLFVFECAWGLPGAEHHLQVRPNLPLIMNTGQAHGIPQAKEKTRGHPRMGRERETHGAGKEGG